MLRVSCDGSDIADDLGHDFGVGRRTDLIHLSRPALSPSPRPFSPLFLLRKEPDTGSITCARRRVCSLRNLVEHVHVVHERASEVGVWVGHHYFPFNAFLALTKLGNSR